MKFTKLWKILAICMALFLSVGSTIAYMTDMDTAVNVVTLGNVKIDLIEKERGSDGTLVKFTDDHPLYPGVYPNGLDTFEGDYWADVHNAVDKIVSVENTGKSAAYVRAWFALRLLMMIISLMKRFI